MRSTAIVSAFILATASIPSVDAVQAPRVSPLGPRSAFESNWKRQRDPQKSLTLDPNVIARGFASDGNPSEGQVASLTSQNNFINFCLTQNVDLTNGKQIEAGSCNQTPMGRIASNNRMPRSKFVFPANLDESLVENTKFTMKMKIQNIVTGNFVNAQTNYYAAPQFTNRNGVIIGHSHVAIQRMPGGFQQTDPLNPLDFAFFKGLNGEADGDGILSVDVVGTEGRPDGLPAGQYRMCSINAAANHQPVLVARAQHGWLDDCVYFTVQSAGGGQNGNGNGNGGGNNNNNNNGAQNGNGNANGTGNGNQNQDQNQGQGQNQNQNGNGTRNGRNGGGRNRNGNGRGRNQGGRRGRNGRGRQN